MVVPAGDEVGRDRIPERTDPRIALEVEAAVVDREGVELDWPGFRLEVGFREPGRDQPIRVGHPGAALVFRDVLRRREVVMLVLEEIVLQGTRDLLVGGLAAVGHFAVGEAGRGCGVGDRVGIPELPDVAVVATGGHVSTGEVRVGDPAVVGTRDWPALRNERFLRGLVVDIGESDVVPAGHAVAARIPEHALVLILVDRHAFLIEIVGVEEGHLIDRHVVGVEPSHDLAGDRRTEAVSDEVIGDAIALAALEGVG